jgi:DNA polymerase III subunit beta
MQMLIDSANLANAARIAAKAIRADHSRRNTILKCCRLTAGTNLRVYGTDLDTGITALADCDVIEPGEAVVDAQKLADIAGKLPRGADVRVETIDGDLIIKCRRSRFTLTMQPLDDYPPELALEDAALPIDLTAADVMALFAGAAAGAARDDKRIYLAGAVLFSEETELGLRLCAVGADGVALSYAGTTAACPGLGAGIIVHRDTCKLTVDLFGDNGAALRINSNVVELASDSVRLTAKLVDSTPTAWRSMVPPGCATNSALVATKDFKRALERCAAVYGNLTGDVAKRAPILRIRWEVGASDGADVCISFGDLRAAPAALDVISAIALSGDADISVDPRKLARLLEELDGAAAGEMGEGEPSLSLSVGDQPGDPLRIDAGLDRYVVVGQMRDFSHITEEAA